MVTKTINIDNAKIDTEKFRAYNHDAMRILGEIEGYDAEFKALVEAVEESTKLPKPTISAFFKSRFKIKTGDAIAKGEVFETLNKALEK